VVQQPRSTRAVPSTGSAGSREASAQAWDFQEGRSLPTTMRAQAPGPIPKETVMRFYNKVHAFYCGVDLHARTMYLCMLDHGSTTG